MKNTVPGPPQSKPQKRSRNEHSEAVGKCQSSKTEGPAQDETCHKHKVTRLRTISPEAETNARSDTSEASEGKHEGRRLRRITFRDRKQDQEARETHGGARGNPRADC